GRVEGESRVRSLLQRISHMTVCSVVAINRPIKVKIYVGGNLATTRTVTSDADLRKQYEQIERQFLRRRMEFERHEFLTNDENGALRRIERVEYVYGKRK